MEEHQPSGMYYEDFEKGQVVVSPGRTITEYDVMAFSGLSGDYNQLHTDQVFAESSMYGKKDRPRTDGTGPGQRIGGPVGIFRWNSSGPDPDQVEIYSPDLPWGHHICPVYGRQEKTCQLPGGRLYPVFGGHSQSGGGNCPDGQLDPGDENQGKGVKKSRKLRSGILDTQQVPQGWFQPGKGKLIPAFLEPFRKDALAI